MTFRLAQSIAHRGGRGAPWRGHWILMHMRGEPATMQKKPFGAT